MSTVYQPMQQVRKNLRVKWYRSPIESAKLREIMCRNDRQGWFQAGGHLLLFAGTGVLTYILFVQAIWIGFALALFAHGTVGSFFKGLAVHELGHGTVFKTKWLNGAFLRFISMLCWHNHHQYAMSHTYHHRYTLYPEGDRELVLPQIPSLKAIFLFQLFTIRIRTGYKGVVPVIQQTIKSALGNFRGPSTFGTEDGEWLHAIYGDQPVAKRKAVNSARITLLFHLGVIAVSIVFELWLLPVLITLAPFIANWWSYFVGLPMHCGLRDNVPDFRLCVRTIKLDPLSEFLYWHMNWHTEHHMYAGVPCYNLSKLHQAIADDMPKPRTLIGAWREMRETWRKQQVDPSYQYDTPLPPARCGAKQGADDQEGFSASIGDLAPESIA